MQGEKKNRISVRKMLSTINVLLAAFLLLMLAQISGVEAYLDAVKDRALAMSHARDANRIVDTCRGQELSGCYKTELVDLIAKKNFKYAVKTLAFIQAVDPATRPCHVLAHYMARAAVEKNPESWLKLLDVVKISECGGGFLHGAFEGHMGYDPSFDINVNSANEICDRYRNDPEKIMSCFHWYGHVFMLEARGDLETALPNCDGILPPERRLNCYDGVFMEFIYQPMLLEHGISTSLNITEEYIAAVLIPTCLRYAGTTEGIACWTEMGEPHMNVSGHDPAYVRDGCNIAPTPKEREACFEKAETIIALQPEFVTPEKLVGVCENFHEGEVGKEYHDCLRRMIGGFAHYPPEYAERANMLCENVRADVRSYCFESIGNAYASVGYSLEDRQEICSAVDHEYKDLCAGRR